MKTKATIIDEHHQTLGLFIKNRVSNTNDAEDILSTVYVKFLAQDDMPVNPIAWLYLVTKNSIIDYFRTQKNHDFFDDKLIDDVENDDHFKDFSACVLPLVSGMSSPDRLLIQCVDIDGVKQQQAAKDLNLSLPALKSRLLRARVKLQKLMVQCCPPVRNQVGEIENFSMPNKVCKKC